MRTYVLSLIIAMCSLGLVAQAQTTDVEIGTILEIGNPKATSYKHIKFPKANMIVKRGGIADYKSVKGYTVVVTDVNENSDGTTIVKIKRKDGGRFFGSHTVVKAQLKKALDSGELRAI